MKATEQTRRTSGWLIKCDYGLPDIGSLHPIQPSIVQSSKQWNIAVYQK